MKMPTSRRVRRYASVILRWVVIGTVVFFATMLAGLYITDNVLPKVYTAKATLRLPSSDLVVPTAGSAPAVVPFQPEFENTMMSPAFLLGIVKDLGLEKEWAKRVDRSDADQVPDVDALTRIAKVLTIEIEHGTDIVEITAASDVPEEAAAIANAVAEHYQSARPAPGTELPVRILTRAEPPTEPARPNKGLAFLATLALACLLSVLAASFVEMILLFIRAGERSEG